VSRDSITSSEEESQFFDGCTIDLNLPPYLCVSSVDQLIEIIVRYNNNSESLNDEEKELIKNTFRDAANDKNQLHDQLTETFIDANVLVFKTREANIKICGSVEEQGTIEASSALLTSVQDYSDRKP
jgi:hypothetical protein